MQRHKIEFGDFQTPDNLAKSICAKLSELGISPNVVIEPTCGTGAFVLAATSEFATISEVHGFEVNEEYLRTLRERLANHPNSGIVKLAQADFFATDWKSVLRSISGSVLVLGNFPWVTNTTQGVIGGTNLPEKSNFLNQKGFDAISGKSNFDISEWMLLDVLRWFKGRSGHIAMLVKTAVARKVLAHAERQKLPVREADIFCIDAKKDFNASVEACLLVIRLSEHASDATYDYSIFKNLNDTRGRRVGHRDGLTVGDLDAFESSSFLLGECPQKWRSGIKHDASAVMELTRTSCGFVNGRGEVIDIEMDFLFPLLKGSDIGSGKPWREKFVLVTQRFVGERTDRIRELGPKTWDYLEAHADTLDARGSTIYKKNPRYSIFGVGDYSFRPWRIAICGLYKSLKFRLVSPIECKPVMFDDTVYYLSFDTESEAHETLALLTAEPSLRLLSSLIFWDEKRPIKTGILNVVDWSRLNKNPKPSLQIEMSLTA
jgi:hypothetical protein